MAGLSASGLKTQIRSYTETDSNVLTDAVLELEKPVDVEQINNYFLEASEGSLKGILGFEMMPLVSTDYVGDPRSCK